jgi:multicomponent Na+:H+ antiporter subunit D
VGVFSVVRIMLDVFGLDVLSEFGLGIATAFFVSFTIITASVIALTKDDLKARLAYSTVSQLSYVILGVALLSPDAVTGGILQIANHAFGKITLFFCAGSIFVASRIKTISELDGIGRHMPYTMAAFTVGSFSLIGVPVFAGFTSKWYIAMGSLGSGHMVFLMVLLVSALLNAAYFLPIVFRAFFKEPQGHMEEVAEAPRFVITPIVVTAILTVFFGLYPDYFVAVIERIIE